MPPKRRQGKPPKKREGKALVASAVAIIGLVWVAIILILLNSSDDTSVASGAKMTAMNTKHALDKCDKLTSTPGDMKRVYAPVADEQFAPVPAVKACTEAVSQNPDNPRAIFQLGRALWLAGQDAEAFERMKQARLAHYPVASLYLGNAFRDGKLGQEANFLTAAELYKEAKALRVEGAEQAYEDINKEIERFTFDKTIFQNGDYMERIYNGDYADLKYPMSMVYYVQGIAAGIEDSNVLFMDQSCSILFSSVGLAVIKHAELAGAGDIVFNSSSFLDFVTKALGAFGSYQGKDILIDQGKRDATALYNGDQGRYGCKSPVTKQIISNMMIIVKNQNGLEVETPFS